MLAAATIAMSAGTFAPLIEANGATIAAMTSASSWRHTARRWLLRCAGGVAMRAGHDLGIAADSAAPRRFGLRAASKIVLRFTEIRLCRCMTMRVRVSVRVT